MKGIGGRGGTSIRPVSDLSYQDLKSGKTIYSKEMLGKMFPEPLTLEMLSQLPTSSSKGNQNQRTCS